MMEVEEYKDAICAWFSDAQRRNTDHFSVDLLWDDMPEHKEGLFKELFVDLPAELGYEFDIKTASFRSDLNGVNITWHRTVKFSEMELLQKACYEN